MEKAESKLWPWWRPGKQACSVMEVHKAAEQGGLQAFGGLARAKSSRLQILASI